MDNNLEDQIFSRYPELFKHREDMKVSLMCFGIETGDGWYKLIDDLCRDIYSYYNNNGGVPEYFYVEQIKEKYGSLRFYVTSAPTEVHDMIQVAEDKSYSICMHCGKPGRYRDDLSWVLTLCDSCLDKYVKRRFHRSRGEGEDFISSWQKKAGAPFIKKEG